MPAGQCANCDAAVSVLARACPRCGLPNQPNAVTTIVALVLAVAFGAGSYLAAAAFLSGRSAAPNAPQATTAQPGEDDYGWLVQAMAECDVYAKQKLETLYFLLIPLMPSGKVVAAWDPAPIGRIGSTGLVSATDAVIGLRNGVFVIYRQPITFAVKDPTTQAIYKWNPSIGVSQQTTQESGLASLMLGLQIGDRTDFDWGATLTVTKGTCYWTNPVIGPSAGNSPAAQPAPAPTAN